MRRFRILNRRSKEQSPDGRDGEQAATTPLALREEEPAPKPFPIEGKGSSSPLSTPARKEKTAQRRGSHWPRLTIDLGRPKHRNILIFSFAGGVIFLTLSLVGSYKTFHYTESAEFCGSTCHPMKSEFVRYEHSPHANVECARCHIGPGASFFVKSKLDGLKQVYAVLANSYRRPIVGPVHNLRPARETCEECHTPTSFKDNIIKTIRHYDNDETNTAVQATLILKMGGWHESTGMSEGIHWHITNPVYYITADEQRQVVIWVGAEQKDGSLKEYYARDMINMARTSFVDEAYAQDQVRLVDCIDCHNRAAHFIPSPDIAVDEALNAGLISLELPYIRAKAIDVLSPMYATEAEGLQAIEGLVDAYRVGYPQAYATYRPELEVAVAELKDIFIHTQFPDMNLNWQTNPNNERHTPFLGCFRCHDDKHVMLDQAGNQLETISAKCNLCHTVPIVGRGDDILIEAPVIVGAVPESHSDFRWTIEHRAIAPAEEEECLDCHGRGFCNNGACHNLSHPPDMMYTHADEYREQGDQVCYTCHQDILCSRCHPGGVIGNP